mgnify:CR=1 FL=1
MTAPDLTHPRLDVDELPGDDGRVWLSDSSTVVHLYERCPHVYHSDTYEATPETFMDVFENDVTRRANPPTLRWCSWCQSRYAREQLDDD